MINKIVPGELTPSLSLNTIVDNQWSLEDNLNKTKTMIVFYRGLHCPICSDFLKTIDNQLSDYKKSPNEPFSLAEICNLPLMIPLT